MGICAAGEAVTREEFQKLVEDVQKLKAENAQLKTSDTEIKAENADLKKQIAKVKPAQVTDLEAELDKYVTQEEFKAIKDTVVTVKPGTTKFLLTGGAITSFVAPEHQPSSFSAEFDPIFLWKMSERLSFEAEVPISVDGSVELEYADIAYVANDYLTIQAGKFKSPFGLFNPRFDPAWINKFADAPMIYDDGSPELMIPHEQVGVNFTGATDAGPTKIRYAVFTGNNLEVEPKDPATFGTVFKSSDFSNNNDKTIGGRLGFLPVPYLEIGASAQYSSNVFPRGDHTAYGRILGLDASMNRDFDPLLGTIDIKTEFVWTRVAPHTYATIAADGTETDVAFNHNHRSGCYAQLAYRPTRVCQKWVKNLEVGVRYDHITNPSATPDTPPDAQFQRVSHDRWTVGLNYYLEPSTVLKADYERDPHFGHVFQLQYAIGF
jgi:hypothetical protein